MKLTTIAAIVTTAVGTLCNIVVAQTPDPLPAEAQKVLKLFVGKCETTIDSDAALKGAATGVLVLGDRFVRDDFVLKDGDGNVVLQVSSMITYDTEAKLYRMWMFSSTGEVTSSEGTWDKDTRTLTTNSRDAKGETTKWKSTFSAEGVETWSLETKDKDGKVVLEVKGKKHGEEQGMIGSGRRLRLQSEKRCVVRHAEGELQLALRVDRCLRERHREGIEVQQIRGFLHTNGERERERLKVRA